VEEATTAVLAGEELGEEVVVPSLGEVAAAAAKTCRRCRLTLRMIFTTRHTKTGLSGGSDRYGCAFGDGAGVNKKLSNTESP
jgi:hypothetical protein